ncbi:MAG: oxidoreductase molybdopterin binding protein [Fibrobacteres bacterium]|nr:oxidoreductase molybdopterin binding protein [Fibrobacterota bacterium]
MPNLLPAKRPARTRTLGVPAGALLGAVLAVPLAVLFYVGGQLADLPFVPFEFFDWMARTLPGSIITLGIDTIVKGIGALGYRDISAAAKLAENILAVGGFLVAGAVLGGILTLALRRWRPPAGPSQGLLTGLAAGLIAGVPALLIDLSMKRVAAVGPWAASIWILCLFGAWGAAMGFILRRLDGLAPAGSTDASATVVDRRTFLISVGGAVATITVGGAWVGAMLSSLRDRERKIGRASGKPWSATLPLPNADTAVTPVRGTRPELTPVAEHYRIDINSIAPVIPEGKWRLRIEGLVDRPMEWTLSELKDHYAPLHQFVTLACISNPVAGSLIGTQRWTGVPLRRLLEDVRPQKAAGYLVIRAADGFDESVALSSVMADDRIMLTYAWDGLPLTPEHGFPLRIYIPDRYGMKQPKWIESIELTEGDVDGYWVRRGWDKEARMKNTSVIDAIGVDMMIVGADSKTRVPIGGIAHAGARGISKVEVQVDGGAWREALLREPISGTTWVLWRYDWPFEKGKHTFTVRCTDGKGELQAEKRSPPHPSGATGLDEKSAML